MTAGEWEAYGDASASHQATTIDGVTYHELPESETAQGKD